MSAKTPWALRSGRFWNNLNLSKPVFPPIKCIHLPEFTGSSWNKKTWPKNVIHLIAKKNKLGKRKAETCKLSVSGNPSARLMENWGLWDNGERQAQASICMMCERPWSQRGSGQPWASGSDCYLLGSLLHSHPWAAWLQGGKGQVSPLAWTLECLGWVRMYFRSLPALRLEGRQAECG